MKTSEAVTYAGARLWNLPVSHCSNTSQPAWTCQLDHLLVTFVCTMYIVHATVSYTRGAPIIGR